jgi:hypothetical protein
MAYGTAIEKMAREHYSQVTGNSAFDSDLIVKHSKSWLCASLGVFWRMQRLAFKSNAPTPVKTQKFL